MFLSFSVSSTQSALPASHIAGEIGKQASSLFCRTPSNANYIKQIFFKFDSPSSTAFQTLAPALIKHPYHIQLKVQTGDVVAARVIAKRHRNIVVRQCRKPRRAVQAHQASSHGLRAHGCSGGHLHPLCDVLPLVGLFYHNVSFLYHAGAGGYRRRNLPGPR